MTIKYAFSLTLPLIALSFFLAPATSDASSACPEPNHASELSEDQEILNAVELCLALDGGDAQVVQIVRVLAEEQRLETARQWVSHAMATAPEDLSWRIWSIRLLAWQGELNAAWHEGLQLERLLPADNIEFQELLADIAFWNHDYYEADKRYARLLSSDPENAKWRRNRGIANQSTKNFTTAGEDFSWLCSAPQYSEIGCPLLKELRQQQANEHVFSAALNTSFGIAAQGSESLNIAASLGWMAHKNLQLGTQVEHRQRFYAAGTARDLLVSAMASYRPQQKWSMSAGASMGIQAQFSPRWSFRLEPTWHGFNPFEFSLMYWRIQFPNHGIHVLSPQTTLYLGSWYLSARYYLSLSDTRDAKHSVLLRAGTSITDRLGLSFGGGLGSAADYLEVRESSADGYFLLLSGLSFRISPSLNWTFDYIFRQEHADALRFRQHQFLTGIGMTF